MRNLALGVLVAGLLAACGSKTTPKIIDSGSGSADSDPASLACNILTQTGCNTGEKCSWIHDQLMPAVSHVGCAPDPASDVAIGAACSYMMPPMGWDNCKAGGVCEGGVCKEICDQAGGAPMCDAMHSCQVYEGFLGPPSMEAAGVCDVTCNPLDDNDFAGSSHTGSACAAGEGCYGFWNGSSATHFSCASVPPHGQTPPPPGSDMLFHRALCTAMAGCENASNQAYLNGCAGGYMPLITTDTAGTNTVSCLAFCKPADCTSDATVGCAAGVNRIGASPHRCNATDNNGKGAFNGAANGDQCVYGWNFEFGSDGKVLHSQFSDTTGICLDHSKYHLLDDAGAASQTAWPACATLPLTASATGSCGGVAGATQPIDGCTAQDFGCVSTTTGMVPLHFQNDQHTAHIERPRLPYHVMSPMGQD